MAFQFPNNPQPNETIVNSTTGVKYQWRDDLNKWVTVAGPAGIDADLIYEGVLPPIGGDYKLWYNSNTLELYFYYTDENGSGAWVPTSKPISELTALVNEVDAAGADIAVMRLNLIEVEDNIENISGRLGQVTLQEVLDNGNVADKGATFGDQVTVERPALGQNTSFNIKGGIRNANDEVVIGNMLRAYHDASDLTKDSGVEYRGKIYNENNVVNKGYVDKAANENAADIETIEGRLDDLERIRNTGRWRLIENISSPSDTEFALMRSNGTIIRQWNEAVALNISAVDNNGVSHDVSSWGEGDKIEVIGDDLSQPAFAMYTLGASPAGARPEMKTIAKCDISENLPIERVVYRVRRFVDSSIDLDQADARYVNTSGDTMTGKLETTNKIWIRPDGQGANGSNNMLVVNQEAATSGSIARFQKNSADVLKVEFDGSTSLMNNRLVKVAAPIDNTDGATKKYVDDAVGAVHGPATHKWIYRKDKGKLELLPGEFTGPQNPKYGNKNNFHYYFHPESLTSKMGFYKDYDMYFPMNAIWGAFHFWDTNYTPQWKLKQYVPVRNIHMFKDDNYLEIYTHTDYPSGGDVISEFSDGREYYFSIGGMI